MRDRRQQIHQGLIRFPGPGGASLNGKTTYPIVNDPEVTELNRLQLTWTPSAAFSTVIGRQRVILDDQRFVGNVGWRQDEQTFDAARVDLAHGRFKATYVYISKVNRIFGVMNRRLADRQFLAGKYSIADIATYPWARYWRRHGMARDGLGRLIAWIEKIEARPAVIRAAAVLAEMGVKAAQDALARAGTTVSITTGNLRDRLPPADVALANLKKTMEYSELAPAELTKVRAKLKPVIDKFSANVGADFAKQVYTEIDKVRGK